MKYNVSNLMIEVTRRCNMCCDHCLRGDAQDLDLDIHLAKECLAYNDRVKEAEVFVNS